jgi:hypothetical protein
MVLSPDMRLQLDRGEAERFLAALDPTADEWTFQTFDDSRERKEENEAKWNARGHTGKKDPFAFTLHGTLASCWSRLIQLNERGAGVFVTVNVTDFKGRKKGEHRARARAIQRSRRHTAR